LFVLATGRNALESVVSRQYPEPFPHWDIALELPTQHRVPVTWLRENACAPIRLRAATDLLPPQSAASEESAELRAEVLQYKHVKQIARKQWQNGSWSGNMLGIAPLKSQGIKDVGTVAQYRRLVELGLPTDSRSFKLAERLFYKVLSRDDSPSLWFEYQKHAVGNPQLHSWARGFIREGVTCALAHAQRIDDPRVRGSAHRIISDVSQFLRSDLADEPLVKKGSKYVLHPDAHPPTVLSVAILAYMPSLQRERAGFVERLGRYLAKPGAPESWSILMGRKAMKPTFHLLGDPLRADDEGNTADIPWSLHWIELIVRLGLLEVAPVAQQILMRLLEDCDEDGIWSPKNLRAIPKGSSKLADFAFPLELDGRTQVRRRTDVTFRLALIAKLAGWTLEYV